MRDVHVCWQRSDHTFTVVRSDGALVADRLKRIEDAWRLAERLERDPGQERFSSNISPNHGSAFVR